MKRFHKFMYLTMTFLVLAMIQLPVELNISAQETNQAQRVTGKVGAVGKC